MKIRAPKLPPDSNSNSKSQIPNSNITYTMDRMDVVLVGANTHAQVIAEGKQDYYENYFTDWSAEKGATTHAYNRITYKDVYPNIDWVLYISSASGGGRDGAALKHEFVVHAGGKVSDIQLKYSGAKRLTLNTDGTLIAATPQGTITEQAPDTYQEDGKKVSSAFKLDGELLTYATGKYNGELIIDPSLVWATYYGGSLDDYGKGVATDGAGNVYIAGSTLSISAIATSGAYQTTFGGGAEDACLAKFNGLGAIQWATYYGGSGDDEGGGVATDGVGNVYMGGYTVSTSGIATPGAYQASFGGGASDAFLVKFDGSDAIQWGTYYGGSGSDGSGTGVTTDGAGNVYLCGYTASASGIATAGAYQGSFGGGAYDAFLAKFNGTGAIQWATYYGGNAGDNAFRAATDGAGNVFICGYTVSTSGIATPGAYQASFGGGTCDAFFAKFNSTGTIQWATYYGGSNTEYGNAVATDGAGNVYITGQTASTSAISTAGAYQTSYGGGGYDGFLVKFNGAGGIQWATYYGGTGDDDAYGATTDGSNVYITGGTSSTSGITTIGAYQPIYGGGANDGFLAKFDGSGALRWATYYGGGALEYGYGLATDGAWNVYLCGATASTSAIATPGAYQPAFGGGTYDAFLAKFNIPCTPSVISGAPSLCVGATTVLSDIDGAGTWTSSSTAVATIGSSTGIVSGLTPGTTIITFTLTSTGCSAIAVDTVLAPPVPISGPSSVCIGATIVLSDAEPGGAWSRSNAAASVGGSSGIVTGVSSGVDTIYYTGRCGVVSTTVTVNPLPFAGTISGATNVCVGSAITLSDTAPGGVWSSGAPGIASVSGTGIVGGIAAGTATISYTVTNVCGVASATQTVVVIAMPVAGSISGVSSVCIGASITLSDATPGGVWTSGAPGIASVSAAGITNGIAPGTAVISYTVTNGSCVASATRTVVVITTPDAGTISGASSVCKGSSIILSDMAPGGVWTSGAPGIASVSGVGVTSGITVGTAAISYTVTNVCGNATASHTVTVLPASACNTGIATITHGEITVLPNPNSGCFSIRGLLGASGETVLVEVADVLGQVVYKEVIGARNGVVDEQITLGNTIANGMYVLRLQSATGSQIFHIVVRR
jgi:hypothetical protein